jgi:hypothetical protein
VRWINFAAIGLVLVGAGCYSPSIKDKGYSCSADRPICPSGFYCVNGRCQGTPGAPGVGGVGEAQDQSMPPAGGDVHDLGSAAQDLASSDLASGSSSPSDMSQPADLRRPPSCGAKGDPCTFFWDCCSNNCGFFSGVCG